MLYKGDTATDIEGNSDADWVGDVRDRKSMSGYVFLLGGATVSWKNCKQNCVAMSTTESEYIALCAASTTNGQFAEQDCAKNYHF